MPYRLCIPPSQTERIAEPLHSGPRSVIAGMPVQIAGDADRRVSEQVGRGFDVDAGFKPADGCRVAQRVRADVRDPSLARCNLNGAQ